jgi:hypothetical protein
MENNNLNKALDKFLDNDATEQSGGTSEGVKLIKQKDGLIERIDKTYITEDNKILLKD